MAINNNLELLKVRLIEAEEAYHKLMCGDKEVSEIGRASCRERVSSPV